MNIRNKLLLNFALLLGALGLGFVFSIYAMYRGHEAKTAFGNALELSLATENVRHQMMENRLALSNYLLTGAGTELDRLHEGTNRTYDLLREAAGQDNRRQPARGIEPHRSHRARLVRQLRR